MIIVEDYTDGLYLIIRPFTLPEKMKQYYYRAELYHYDGSRIIPPEWGSMDILRACGALYSGSIIIYSEKNQQKTTVNH